MKKMIYSLAFLCLGVTVQAQWIYNGMPVCTEVESQVYPKICSDGRGGAIIVWQDYRSSNDDIYVQRYDSLGNAKWGINGKAVCNYTNNQRSPQIASDGNYGAYIVWVDYRNGWQPDIYAQRIDSMGNPYWSANGIAVCAQESVQQNISISVNETKDLLIAWEDRRVRNNNLIYAQKISPSGVPQWTSNGVALTSNGITPKIITDGSGGAIVAWSSSLSSTNYDIYARRVDNSGVPQWANNGNVICNSAAMDSSISILPDGNGGAFIVWYSGGDIYAQRINNSGVVQWIANGVAICNATGTQTMPQIIVDGGGGALISWLDARSGATGIYMQRINNTGGSLWQSNGVRVVASLPIKYDIMIDHDGGAYLAFVPTTGQVWTQWVDNTGKPRLDTTAGVRVCAATQANFPSVLCAARGRGFTVWQDNRNGNLDIYAQWLDTLGQWGINAPRIDSVKDIGGDQGGKLTIKWSPCYRESIGDTSVYLYSIWQRVSDVKSNNILSWDNRTELTDLAGLYAKDQKGYYWYCVATVPVKYLPSYRIMATTMADSGLGGAINYQWYLVTAHTKNPKIFWDSSIDSGYSLDNLAPAKVRNLTGNVTGGGMHISWVRNSERDLLHYSIYKGGDSLFTPDPSNRLGSTLDTVFLDVGYVVGERYKVTAVDYHGNESEPELLREFTGTMGEPPKEIPSDFLLEAANPNPAGAGTVISYHLPHKCRVYIKVYSLSGQLVKSLVDGMKEPGIHRATWNCRDERGKKVSAGIYLYRMTAGEYSEIKKMVVIK